MNKLKSLLISSLLAYSAVGYTDQITNYADPIFQGYTNGMAKALGIYGQYEFCETNNKKFELAFSNNDIDETPNMWVAVYPENMHPLNDDKRLNFYSAVVGLTAFDRAKTHVVFKTSNPLGQITLIMNYPQATCQALILPNNKKPYLEIGKIVHGVIGL